MATLLFAVAAVIAAWTLFRDQRRIAFAFGLIVGSNASAVIHASFGLPAFLLPLSLATLALGGLRVLRHPEGVRAPRNALPVATLAALAAIVLSAALGPFVAIDVSSSSAAFGRLLEHLLVVGAAAMLASRADGLRALIGGLVTAGTVLSLLTVWQAIFDGHTTSFGGFSSWNQEVLGGVGDSLRAAGPFTDDPNAYAQYLVVCSALAIGTLRGNRAKSSTFAMTAGAIVSMAVAIILTASRAGVVALVVVMIVAAWTTGVRSHRVAVAASVVAIAVWSPFGVGERLGSLAANPTSAEADSGLRGRASEMIVAVRMLGDHPVTGVGYGTYNDRYLDYSRDLGIDDRFERRSAHSLPLEIGAEQGLVGLTAWAAFGWAAATVIRRLRARLPELAFALALAGVGFIVTALFLHDVHPRLMWSMVGMVLGGAWIIERSRADAISPSAPPDEPLRVAMVIQSYVPAVGGAERQLASLMPFFTARGIDPIVVTRSMAGRPGNDVIDGVPVIRLPVVGPKPLQSLMFVAQARAVLDRFQPHVVHAFDSLTPTTIALGHRRRTGTPVIVKLLRSGVLGDLYRLRSKPFGQLRLRRLVREADAVVAISSELERELDAAGVGLDRRVLIPNGVDTQRFAPPRRSTRSASGDLRIIATGRLAPEKRLVELAERWHRVTDRFPGAQLIVVGEGPEAERLEPYGGVQLLGRRGDVSELLRDADLYVSASSAEGLSNSLLEAMASGLPCIVTDVGGVRDVINVDTQGAIVPADDIDELVDRIIGLLENTARRRAMRRAARRRAIRHFSIERTANDLADLYERVGAHDRSPADVAVPRAAAADAGVAP